MRQSPVESLREDAELIRSALEGSEAAFAGLLAKYRRQVYTLALKMLGQAEDAEDASQDAFIRAFQSLESCDPNRPFSRWIYRITYNLCVDRFRRRKFVAVSFEQSADEEGRPREFADAGPGPDALYEASDAERRISDLLTSLPPRYRMVVVLRHQQQLSYEEIAEVMSLPLGTVKARIHRAHNMLRKALQRKGVGPGRSGGGL
jgi:RNA polymerase sigma-70 factor (ECF subfamily)